ncbi:MAG: hypothetical protein K6T66_03105 [Peptococcaceae bacterium]|nr:hypothetical protein [Peptococcaceae bacterium]
MSGTMVKIHQSGSHLVIRTAGPGAASRRDFYLSLKAWRQLDGDGGRAVERDGNSFADLRVIRSLDLICIDFFWLNAMEGGVRGRQETVCLTFSQVRAWVRAGARGTYRQISVNPSAPNRVVID